MKYANQAAVGQITQAQFKKITASAQAEENNVDQRVKAAEVSVLRAAKYYDWEMYSRYSVHGIGDLWNKNIIAGEKVANQPNHPHCKYTYRSFWPIDVLKICRGCE